AKAEPATTTQQPTQGEQTAAKGSTSPPAERKAAPKEEDQGGGGRTLKAVAVGAPMLVSGILAGVLALGLTSLGSVTTAVGFLQWQNGELRDELRIMANTATVLGPALGIASVILAVGGLMVLVLLR
ncbi:MAG: hypothetical protein AB2A00_42515, partial [Myxococcota bacterium]